MCNTTRAPWLRISLRELLPPLLPSLPVSSSFAVSSYEPAPISSAYTRHVNLIRLTQALHNVLGPIGPLLHSGVSVAPHPRHLGAFLSPFAPAPDPDPLGAERLFDNVGGGGMDED